MLRTKHIVQIVVDAPVDFDVSNMVDELIGEALHACDLHIEGSEPDVAAKAADYKDCEFSPASSHEWEGHRYDSGPVCEVDWDCACYFGDGEDGVYFDADKGKDGKWYVSGTIDTNSNGNCDELFKDVGPFGTAERALRAGLEGAAEALESFDLEDADACYAESLREYKRRAAALEQLI